MEVLHYIEKDYQAVFTNSPVADIRNELNRHEYVVVLRPGCQSYVGILARADLEGLRDESILSNIPMYPKMRHCDHADAAYRIMTTEKKDVLPVFKEEALMGLLYRHRLQEKILEELKHAKTEITTLKAELNAVRKMRAILRALYKDTQAIRFFVAPDNTIIYFNSNAEKEMLSASGTEMKVGDSMEIFSQRVLNNVDKQYDEYFKRSINGEYILTESLLTAGHDSIWVSTEYNPIRDEGNIIGVSVSITNITDRKRSELLIKKQNEVLRHIVFKQSHHVRGPIATTLGLLNIFDRESLSKENRKLIEMMEKTVQSLDDSVKEVVYQIHELRSQENWQQDAS